MAARERIRLSRMTNPGTTDGWIPAHAVRMLPSGDIQLLTERGTMSNPGKRKSFLKKVGKVFGKVVGTGRKVIGNPKHRGKGYSTRSEAESHLQEWRDAGYTVRVFTRGGRWFIGRTA